MSEAPQTQPEGRARKILGIISLTAALAALIFLIIDIAFARQLFENRFALEMSGMPFSLVHTLVILPSALSVVATLMGLVSGIRIFRNTRTSKLGLPGMFIGGIVFLLHTGSLISGSEGPPGDFHATSAMKNITAAVEQYRQIDGSYPDSMERITKEDSYQPPQKVLAKYNITYTPGTPDSNGNISRFAVTVQPKEFQKDFLTGWANYYIDQERIIRYTVENRPATALDPGLQGERRFIP